MKFDCGFACDCNSIIGLKEAKNVFVGKVTGIQKIERPYIRYEIEFSVTKVIKGKINTRTIVVNTPSLDDGGCGIPFGVNETYEVYTYLEETLLYTGDCTATKKLEE